MKEYIPKPIDVSDVEIPTELEPLREAIAENIHEVWSAGRMKEGWTYGPTRDDFKKHHPNILPYHLLPENEKRYARQMATNTIKLLKKLGWDLVKRK